MTRFEIYATTFKALLQLAVNRPYKYSWNELIDLRKIVYSWFLYDQITIRQYTYFDSKISNAFKMIYRN